MRLWLLHALVPPLLTLLAVFGLAASGDSAATALRAGRAPTITFADVVVTPPPGLTRTEFLAEVQYQSDLPDRVSLQDSETFARLDAAFAKHAWVEKVERIELHGNRPPQVQLRYRQPVLLVPYREQKCVLDRRGVMLPRAAQRPDLPVYRGAVAISPLTGTPWQESRVLACAVVLGYLGGEHGVVSVLVDTRGVVLQQQGGTEVVWGHPPGREAADEASAAVKRQRLSNAGNPISNRTLDLRPIGTALVQVRP